MDSLTQIVLGASVSETVMQNKVGRKATLWGAIIGTLPDLDVFIPMGNAVKNFTYHRAESHAFFYMALATPILAWLITKIHPNTKLYRWRWLFAVFLTLITHAILDSFTVYGTQLFLPFTNYPVGWNTIFVIDPIYTLPLILSLIMLFFIKNKPLGLKLNKYAIIFSTIYLGWGITAQQIVRSQAENAFQKQNIEVTQSLVGPTPFNTFLWRIVGMTEEGYVEGFYSVFDETDEIKFKKYSSEKQLIDPIRDNWNVDRLVWFSKGFYKVNEMDQKVILSDLRMGYGEMYFFSFEVAEMKQSQIKLTEVSQKEIEGGFENLDPLKNLWKRIWDEDVEF